MTSPSTAALSLSSLRAQFPALDRVHSGRLVAYFDGPGGTQVPLAVVEAVTDYLLHHNANSHWHYPTSEETDAVLDAARHAFADLLGGTPEEVVFGANMTSLTFHLSRALGRSWGPGDEVVVTELDHHANVDPWRALTRERGLTIRSVPFDAETGELDLNAVEAALGPRTRLLALGAASNALGTINDVARAAALARASGALVFVDAVHLAPHAHLDVHAFGADFLACSAYKFYGPHVGVLWGRRDLLERLDVPKLEPAPNEPPVRLETGTLNHEGIAGAAAAVDFLAAIGGSGAPAVAGTARRAALGRAFSLLHDQGEVLLQRLWNGLAGIFGVRLFGPPPGRPRTPTVAFTVAGRTPIEVAEALASQAVFVSHGDFYATSVVRRYGQTEHGLVRAGCAAYTTAEEVERLLEAVEAVARR
jgi:cysteine desulfurase family protein (TIGR01976 family)